MNSFLTVRAIWLILKNNIFHLCMLLESVDKLNYYFENGHFLISLLWSLWEKYPQLKYKDSNFSGSQKFISSSWFFAVVEFNFSFSGLPNSSNLKCNHLPNSTIRFSNIKLMKTIWCELLSSKPPRNAEVGRIIVLALRFSLLSLDQVSGVLILAETVIVFIVNANYNY